MQKAIIELIFKHPFFGILAMKLRKVETKNVPTAGVDGKNLYYNPDYIKTLNLQEQQGLVAHEIMHCALQHIARRQYRDHKKWNKACDYAINGNLLKQGFILPPKGLVNHDWDDFGAEHIYSLLPNDDGDGNGPGDGWNWGEVMDGLEPGASESEQKALEAEWQINVQQAVNEAKLKGKLPADIERLVADILKPQISWKDMLMKYIHVPVKDDYNWARPNKRFMQMGIILPTLYSHAMGDVAVIVDTSGSISDDELQYFAAELSGICEDAKPRKVHVIYCDTEVHKHDEFGKDEYPIKMKAVGGGGTDMKPAFDLIAGFTEAPECIICLTDMYLDTDHINYPACDTLWVSTGLTDVETKFGEITKLEIGRE